MQTAGDELERIRAGFLRELELARRLRMEAEKYQRDIIQRAQSQAQLLILQARTAVKKELAEAGLKNHREMKKLLNDMRVLRVTAQEELEAQRMFTDAARLKNMNLAFPSEDLEGSDIEGEAVRV